jgi:D-glycero-beta-D-manno-heptose-7-phosphate kinase
LQGLALVTFSKIRLQTLYNTFAGKRIAVVGDLMLDRYFWGSVARISPEAPVPVVEVESESTRLGGAANVANNIASLGGIPVMIGVIGKDDAGNTLKKIVEEQGFPTTGIVLDESRPTTIKTRVIAHSQHVVRIDREGKRDVGEEVQLQLLKSLELQLDTLEGIILEDYNKGVLAKSLIVRIIELARKKKKIVAVDPKFNNFFEYRNVTIFKPNRKETEEALGTRLSTSEDITKAGRKLMDQLGAENVLLTLGESGMSLFEKNGTISTIPTAARRVADVSGAGDTVIATLTMALASGANIGESATLANLAGGIVCGEVGIVPIDKEILFEAVLAMRNGTAENENG